MYKYPSSVLQIKYLSVLPSCPVCSAATRTHGNDGKPRKYKVTVQLSQHTAGTSGRDTHKASREKLSEIQVCFQIMAFIESPDFALRQMTHNPHNAKGHIFTIESGMFIGNKEVTSHIRNGSNYDMIHEVGLGFDSDRCLQVVGYVNGVVCLRFNTSRSYPNLEIGLSNPSIKKFLRVPSPSMLMSEVFLDIAIGYDYVRNNIKLLTVGYPKDFDGRGPYDVPSFEVYGVGEKSWRNINVVDMPNAKGLLTLFHSYQLHYKPRASVNGALHWDLWDPYHYNDTELSLAYAVAFDMGKEVFTYFMLPNRGKWRENVARLLVVFEETLGVVDIFETHWNLWSMRQYGVEDSWQILDKIDITLLGGSKIEYLQKDGDLLYWEVDGQRRLMATNIPKRETRCVATNKYSFQDVCFTDTYVESLLLLTD